MDFINPFTTYFRDNPDFNESDRLNEVANLIQRQDLIQSVAEDGAPLDELLDVLEFQGIDPVEYVALIAANVEFAIAENLIVTPRPGLILLP